MNTKLIKKGDLAVIAVVVAAALIFAFFNYRNAENPVAVITVDGVTVETVDLASVKEKITIKPQTAFNVEIAAENGEIWFEHSDCEDRLCVATGKLKNGGDTAVCLPAKTVITIMGSDVDAVVY